MKTKNLELYVHIPFCVKKCNYCDFLSFPCDEPTQQEYVSALIREIGFYGTSMRDYEVSTIYFGGGTPSWLEELQMLRILDALGEHFTISPDAEVTLECNPGTVTAGKLALYRKNGINRLSIGLQSTDNRELNILGRIHTFEQFLKTYEMARNAGFTNINIDLMSGIPYQSTESLAKSLKRVINLKPEHVSAYSLIVEKGTPFYDKYKFDLVKQEAGMQPDMLPHEDEVYRMYKLTQMMLTEAGFKRYEISNYAKKGRECKHNVGYWTRENYLGLGLGAASLIDNIRYSNNRDLYDYIDNTRQIETCLFSSPIENDPSQTMGTNLHISAEQLSRKAAMEEFMFLGLRMTEGVARADFERDFGTPIEAVYQAPIMELKKEGLLVAREGKIALTERGIDVANYAMEKFLL